MNTEALAGLALAFSLLALAWLGWRDPKRRRSLGRSGRAGVAERRGLTLLALLPGAVLALAGAWPAWLLWLGGLAVGGWGLVLGFSRNHDATPPGLSGLRDGD